MNFGRIARRAREDLRMLVDRLQRRQPEALPPPDLAPLPRPPEHDDYYHELANRLTVQRLRVQRIERELERLGPHHDRGGPP